MKLYGITTTYNCEDLIPYVMPYVCRLGYDKWVVYDDHSTDRTVELLSQYDFVEIRQFSENKMEDLVEFETRKRNLALGLYLELYTEVMRTGELTAITVTDFDEVIFSNFITSFKDELEYMYKYDDCNYLATKMINLLPPSRSTEVKAMLDGHTLVHSLEGMRGSIWKVGGMKPVLFIVNDVERYTVTLGNHYACFKTVDKKPLKNYDEIGSFYVFHLKFVSRNEYLKRQKDYQNGNMMPWAHEEHACDVFDNSLLASSFPLETYFCMKQLNGIRSMVEGVYDDNNYNE